MNIQFETRDALQEMIAEGILLSRIVLLNAVISGYNTAEKNFDVDSHNVQRRAAMWLVSNGVIVSQNEKWFFTPLANLVDAR